MPVMHPLTGNTDGRMPKARQASVAFSGKEFDSTLGYPGEGPKTVAYCNTCGSVLLALRGRCRRLCPDCGSKASHSCAECGTLVTCLACCFSEQVNVQTSNRKSNQSHTHAYTSRQTLTARQAAPTHQHSSHAKLRRCNLQQSQLPASRKCHRTAL